MSFFMPLGPGFSHFGHDLLLERYFLSHEKPNAGQNCFQTVNIFFSSACFFDIFFYPCPSRFWQSTFSTDLHWYFKESCTLSLASFQLEHPLRMQASSRFWLW